MSELSYDKTVLNVKHDFQLTYDVSGAYPHQNADGSNPLFKVEVEGPTLGGGLEVLKTLGRGSEILLDIIISAAAKTAGHDPELSREELLKKEGFSEFLNSTERWVSIEMVFKNTSGSEYDGERVRFTLTAPSYLIAHVAFCRVASEQNVKNLTSSFMPAEWWAKQEY